MSIDLYNEQYILVYVSHWRGQEYPQNITAKDYIFMSKKDYVLIAKIFNVYAGTKNSAKDIAKSLAEVFKCENPRFDTKRFLTACGITE